MAGINIPGVTDKYNTNDTVEKLMQIERIPLTREQKQLDEYKSQKDAWREINTQLTSLRDSTKTLYSYENPFNNKITSSTDEMAITADANRGAQIQSFKIDVIQPATADRFLTEELANDYKVPSGMFTFKVNDKQVNINWKGGSLKEFSDAINKRSNGIVKSMIIGASAGKKTLLIESLVTGKENKLIFEGAAKDFAIESGMIAPVQSKSEEFGKSLADFTAIQPQQNKDRSRMPELSISKVKVVESQVDVEPRGAFKAAIPENIKNNSKYHITFTATAELVDDITDELNLKLIQPVIPNAGFAEFEGIVIQNVKSDTLIDSPAVPPEPLDPIVNTSIFYAVMADGSERPISSPDILSGEENTFDLDLNEYKGIQAISIRNENTSYRLHITTFSTYDSSAKLGFSPKHAITEAGDAIIKYEGITITRPTNTIDDVVPEITLNVHEKTDRTATISVKADKEASKNALIDFVGKYNQAVARINILSQTKNEIIDELDYLTDDEKAKYREQLGMFQTDFSLTSIKSSMQSILNTSYLFSDTATISMLSQMGIATNASGYSGSYSQSRLRGYLEIDEKKLDSAIENNLDDIKNIFGYDSDGDLIVDTGIAYNLDKQISAYTQTGGILALKTSTLDSKIKSSETKISRLEEQMNDKEAELRQKYSSMQGTLNSLETQQNTIENFTRQQNRQKD